jgi:phosphinothricin acetyltransferase
MAEYVLRAMEERFLDEVLQIYSHYVLNTTATFHARQPTREEMRALVFFARERYRTFVILAGGEVCGYVLVSQHKPREAYDGTAEVSVYLKPAYTGRGIGSLALQHIEAFAREQGLHVLVATITGENERSIRLFAQSGYEKCAHYREVGRKFGRLLDVVAYQKILS